MMRRRRTTIGGQFAPRLIEMLESPAFRVLTLSARRVLDRVEIELAHHGGADNGRLPVTYDDFQSYGIDRHAIGPAIREACALGFLEVTERGRAGNAEFRSPSLYRLTYIGGWRKKDDPTHEWCRFNSIECALQMRDKARAEVSRDYRPSRFKKQKSNEEKPPISVRENPTERAQAPVSVPPTTAMVENPPLLSIFGEGTRSAPIRSAVASAPSPPPQELVAIVMQSLGCSRTEAINRLKVVPDLNHEGTAA